MENISETDHAERTGCANQKTLRIGALGMTTDKPDTMVAVDTFEARVRYALSAIFIQLCAHANPQG